MTTSKATLYETDFYQWAETTVQLLKERKFNELELDNLIEEIEELGRSQKKAAASNLRILLLHLLKWAYQPSNRDNGWLASINEHKRRLLDDFEESTSLKRHFDEAFDKCYRKAKEDASIEMRIDVALLPKACPFSQDHVLQVGWLPEKQ